MKYLLKTSISLLLLVTIILSACVEENISNNENLQLTFSCDTLLLDTLFAEQQSATGRFMIYNENKNALNISSIRLGGGSSSHFRFNVDGHIAGKGETLNNIVIKGRDSLFVFVEFTAPTTDLNSHLLILDSLIFECNNHIKDVKLIAVSSDARILRNAIYTTNTTIDSLRPNLVFNHIYVAEGAKLTITEGAKLYMHAGANIIIDGELECRGTLEHPIIIRGDRFDCINDVDQTPYDQMPAQWGAIYLQNPNSHNIIEHTHIRGADLGILLVGANRGEPILELRNSVIHNSGAYGVYAQQGSLVIENSEISNCGEACLLQLGGSLRMAHTTIANYYRYADRKTASVRILNHFKQNGTSLYFPITSTVIENSIIFGSNAEELELGVDTTTIVDYNVILSHTLIKGKRLETPNFIDCYWAKSRNERNGIDTVFVNTSIVNIAETGYFNFHLDSLSHARNLGSPQVSNLYPLDLDGNNRNSDGKPDLGAYER
jgi:hypothetical protein